MADYYYVLLCNNNALGKVDGHGSSGSAYIKNDQVFPSVLLILRRSIKRIWAKSKEMEAIDKMGESILICGRTDSWTIDGLLRRCMLETLLINRSIMGGYRGSVPKIE